MNFALLDRRPIVVALAGPNGAGKTTFYHAHLQRAALRFVNADLLSRELEPDPYMAAQVADRVRRRLVAERESFIFETVFSDPVGDKLQFLRETAAGGYTVVLCFIGISGPEVSEERVAMRVSQGGHDVPAEKLERLKKYCSHLERGFLGFGEASAKEQVQKNPVTEPKRSQNPKRPLRPSWFPNGFSIFENARLSRFPRTLANLKLAIRTLPLVFVYDNDDLRSPYRQVAIFENGRAATLAKRMPAWLAPLL